MRSVFIGSVEFSEKALKKLIDLGIDITGVITKSESSFNSDFVDLSKLAKEYDIPFIYTKDINSEEIKIWIKERNPEVIFCLGWSQILGVQILNIPPKGVVGYHPAKLPQNKGRHPLIWAIVLGLEQTASTFFIMNEGADTGDIISQKDFKINFNDYASDVYTKMIDTALQQLDDFIPEMINNSLTRTPQEPGTGNSWRKRGKNDGEIDFRMSTESIYNLIRGLSKPYVGAHLVYQGKEFKVWKSTPAEYKPKNIEPGKVLKIDRNKIKVKTGDSAIWLEKHELYNLPNTGDYIR